MATLNQMSIPARNGATKYVSNETYACKLHGTLNGNLCERCLAGLAGYSPLFDPRSVLSYLFNPLHDGPARMVVGLLWKVIVFIAQVLSSVFVCFFLMWFVQPSLTPQEEQRKRDLDDERKKAADEAWRARKEAEHEERQAEQEAWEKQRDSDYMKKKSDQEAWEKERDAQYQKRVKEHAEWQKEQDDNFRKRAQENWEGRQKELEDQRERQEKAVQEVRALAEKIATSNSDPENELRRIEAVSKEIKAMDGPPVKDASASVDLYTKDAMDKKMDKAFDQIDKAINVFEKIDPLDNDGSGDVKVDKFVDGAVQSYEDAEKIKERRKK